MMFSKKLCQVYDTILVKVSYNTSTYLQKQLHNVIVCHPEADLLGVWVLWDLWSKSVCFCCTIK